MSGWDRFIMFLGYLTLAGFILSIGGAALMYYIQGRQSNPPH